MSPPLVRTCNARRYSERRRVRESHGVTHGVVIAGAPGMKCTLALLAVVGCSSESTPKGPPLEEVLRADPVLPALVAGLDKIAPALAAEAVKPIDLPKGKLVVSNISSDPAKRPNAKLVYATDIKVGWRGYNDQMIHETRELAECYQLGKAGALPPQGERDKPEVPPGGYAKSIIEACAGVEYVLVIRRERTGTTKDYQTRTYSGGSEHGDVLVYELATGTYHGGFQYWVALDGDMPDNANFDSYVQTDVRDTIEKKLVEAGATLVASNR